MRLPPNLSNALGLERKAGPITALHFFDFDGTLVRTPTPADGKRRYLAATGTPWQGGWWGRLGSLSPPVLDSPCPAALVVRSVYAEMADVVARSQTSVGVVATGRIAALREAVLRILDEIGGARGGVMLHHEAVFTHPGGRLSTLEFKRQLLRILLTSEPLSKCDIRQLHIWEDRKEHAEFFASEMAEELQELTGVTTTVHYITESTP